MYPGTAVMPAPLITVRPCVVTCPGLTEAIFPPRITIVPFSITEPLPTTMRTLVIAASWAAATAADAQNRHASRSAFFIVRRMVSRGRFVGAAAVQGRHLRPHRPQVRGQL